MKGTVLSRTVPNTLENRLLGKIDGRNGKRHPPALLRTNYQSSAAVQFLGGNVFEASPVKDGTASRRKLIRFANLHYRACIYVDIITRID